MKNKPSPADNSQDQPTPKLIPVTVPVPENFHNIMTLLCDDRAITLGELLRFVAEEYASQQFMNGDGAQGDGEHEAHLLRGILRDRRGFHHSAS